MKITNFYVFYTFNNKLQKKLFYWDVYQIVILFMLLDYY